MEQEVREGYAGRLRQALRARGHTSTRTNSGVDVGALAGATGVSYEMARKYAEAQSIPRPDVQEKIAKWLKVPQAWLQFGEGNMDALTHGNIDKTQLKQCFEAIREATKKTGQNLTLDQEVDLALYLYTAPDDRNTNKISSLIKLISQ